MSVKRERRSYGVGDLFEWYRLDPNDKTIYTIIGIYLDTIILMYSHETGGHWDVFKHDASYEYMDKYMIPVDIKDRT